ncbi:MAG: RutC family protein YjgH [Verrucomicrobiota bacterium]|jgi:enamine deaminase RidA (YjgF/YER057c/UK114 family)
MKSKRKTLPRRARTAARATPRKAAKTRVKISALHPAGVPVADVGYTPGLLAEGRRLIVVSGQGPEDMHADMETQSRQIFDRIAKVLEAAGATMKNIVMLRVYFVHLARALPAYRKVRKEYLSAPYPASTAVGVTELAHPDLELEIEAVAVI